MVELITLRSRGVIIDQYNQSMNGYDHVDQQVSYYAAHGRKTIKWWKKIFTRILKLAQVNSHILYVLNHQNGTKLIPLADFKEKLMLQIIVISTPPAPMAAIPVKINIQFSSCTSAHIHKHQFNSQIIMYRIYIFM